MVGSLVENYHESCRPVQPCQEGCCPGTKELGADHSLVQRRSNEMRGTPVFGGEASLDRGRKKTVEKVEGY